MQTEEIKSNWTGSLKSFENVRSQILDRFGPKAAAKYNAHNCLTYNQWGKYGYEVIKGSRSLKSIVMVEKKDKAGKVLSTYPKEISLFFENQVKKM